MRRILIVDDSPAVRKSLEATLEPWGFEIEHAENGAVALTKLQRAAFDVVLLDINMPVLDGPSLLRIMRARGISAEVILVTSGAATQLVTSTIRLGTAEYLSKPFTPEQVRRAVAKVAGLDLSSMEVSRPRVLLQHPDEDVRRQLRELVPEHVDVDPAPTFKECLDLAERSQYRLVLIDAAVLEGEVGAAAALVRERQREAGILALSPRAAPADRYRADGALDGLVPSRLDEDLVHDFLYVQYLRPLVFSQGVSLVAAGFRGAPEALDGYFGQLARVLGSAAERRAEAAGEITVDLARVPADAGRLAVLLRSVCDRLAASGLAAAFRVPEAARAALAERPDLARVVLLESVPD